MAAKRFRSALGCALHGHKWESEPRYSTYIYCSRCEETCEIESTETPVAA